MRTAEFAKDRLRLRKSKTDENGRAVHETCYVHELLKNASDRQKSP